MLVSRCMVVRGQVLKGCIPKGPDGHPSLWWMMPAGMVSSISAQLIAYPGDTVRKFMIVNGADGRPRAFKNTWVCEGEPEPMWPQCARGP